MTSVRGIGKSYPNSGEQLRAGGITVRSALIGDFHGWSFTIRATFLEAGPAAARVALRYRTSDYKHN